MVHSCAISQSGAVHCWGSNGQGQLGVGLQTTGVWSPHAVGEAKSYVTLASGAYTTCAIDEAGDLACWGDGRSKQLDDAAQSSNEPTAIAGLSKVTKVAVGLNHICAEHDGMVSCWGDGAFGQLGLETVNYPFEKALQIPPSAHNNVIDMGVSTLTAGDHHSCAVLLSGRLTCWDLGSSGQLGGETAAVHSDLVYVSDDDTWRHVSAGANASCGLRAPTPMHNTQLYCWGAHGYAQTGTKTPGFATTPQEVDSQLVWSNVSVGQHSACAIGNALPDSTKTEIHCWGSNATMQLGDKNTERTSQWQPTIADDSGEQFKLGERGWLSLSVGHSHACARDDKRKMLCWGDNRGGHLGTDGQDRHFVTNPARVGTSLIGWRQVEAGRNQTCGRFKPDPSKPSRIKCWGAHYGALHDIEGTNGAIDIAVGDQTACAIMQIGSTGAGVLNCWGTPVSTLLGSSPPSEYETLVKIDTVPAMDNWFDVDLGTKHACALRKTAVVSGKLQGTLWCWGSNEDGRLGLNDSSIVEATSPLQVKLASAELPDDEWTSLRVKGGTTVVTHASGKKYVFGKGDAGRLGLGDDLDRISPEVFRTTTNQETGWLTVAPGSAETGCGIAGGDSEGKLYCWGMGRHGETGTNPKQFDAAWTLYPQPVFFDED